MLQQLCDDTSDSFVIENNGVAPDRGCSPFLSNAIVSNEKSITSDIASRRSVDAAAWCKQAVKLM